MIGSDPGVTAENLGLGRIFYMFFQRDRIGAREADQFEKQAEQIAVILRLPLQLPTSAKR
jgi:hypothetical protein